MELDRLAVSHSVNASGTSTSGADSTEALDESGEPEPPSWDHRRSLPNYLDIFGILKTFVSQIKDLICSERINVLLVFVPVGIVVGLADVDPILDFILNALAIIPLAVVISTATESLASRLGDTLGALLNVTVGNTAELMIFFVALAKDQIRIVQASLVGSVLANSLLVLGTAFLAGTLKYNHEQHDRPAGQITVCLLDFGLLVSMFPVRYCYLAI